MTRLFSVLLLALLVLPCAARADDDADTGITADSAIQAVTVYSNRAKVTRVATVSVPRGAHAVVFRDLPAILLPDSLRAEGEAEAAVKFGAVASKVVMSTQLTSQREQEINARLETLRDQRSLLAAEKTAFNDKKTFLENIGQQAQLRANENIAQMDIKPDQWAGAAEALFAGLSDVLKAVALQDVKLRDVDREIAKTQAELGRLQTGQRSTYTVTIPLEAEAATKLKISLSYQVPNATWQPLYDARLSTEGKGSVQLTQFGAVSQTTGEDWKDVALTLSTAQPQRGASLPDLQPMWVDSYEPNRRMAAQEMMMDSAESFDGGGGPGAATFKSMSQNIVSARGVLGAPAPAAAPEPKAATFNAAQVNAGGFVSEYKIPGPSTVLSDGEDSKLMVGDFDIASKLEIHIKPQLSDSAFLVAKSKLRGDAPILPGTVSLFRDGAYVGQSSIRLLRPDEEYDFYFGIDDQVSVKRKVLKDERKEEGMIARTSVLERDYATEIQNLHKDPVDVVVKETTPAPRNEKIKVEVLKDATTDGYKDNSDNIKGMLYWPFTLQPKEKKELKLGWTISWPKDETLSGLGY